MQFVMHLSDSAGHATVQLYRANFVKKVTIRDE
jgi:hypothetical protein